MAKGKPPKSTPRIWRRVQAGGKRETGSREEFIRRRDGKKEGGECGDGSQK